MHISDSPVGKTLRSAPSTKEQPHIQGNVLYLVRVYSVMRTRTIKNSNYVFLVRDLKPDNKQARVVSDWACFLTTHSQ